VRVVKLVIRPVVAALLIALVVKGHYVNDCLRMLLLLLLGDAVGLQRSLPFLG